MRHLLLILAAALLVTVRLQAAPGLVIYAAEVGVAKFHRMDNKIHHYDPSNAWAHFVMPDNAQVSLTEPFVMNNNDGSVTIFFSNLEDLLVTSAKIATQKGTKISAININSHGMPGGLWFPMDQKQMASMECLDWVAAAKAKDDVNYKQYYSPVSKSEIMNFRKLSQSAGGHYGCVVGATEWKTVVARHPEVKDAFDNGTNINLLGCLVGLGSAGEVYTGTIASLLLSDRDAVVKSITPFGLGDWSMPEGLGFWDYQTDQQLNHDNEVYPKDRQDREIMQKGVVRVTAFVKGQAMHRMVADQSFMPLVGPMKMLHYYDYVSTGRDDERPKFDAPLYIRIPGTTVVAPRLN